jgi:hypothetical protein
MGFDGAMGLGFTIGGFSLGSDSSAGGGTQPVKAKEILNRKPNWRYQVCVLPDMPSPLCARMAPMDGL